MIHRTALIVLAIGLSSAGAAGKAPGPAVTPPADALYTDALAKEEAVRTALAPAQAAITVLEAVRTVVQQYELIVRTYPTSGYCDDALWQAGQLSLDAFAKFKEAQDRDAALRLLRHLASQYPASKFARQVPGELARAGTMGDPVAVVARAEPSAPVLRTSNPPPATASSPPPSSPTPAATPAASLAAPAASVRTAGPVSAIATIKDIRRAILPDVVRVTIELDTEVKSFHEERLDDPARVFIDLSATRAAPALVDQTLRFDGDGELVRQIRLGRHPNNTTRIVLEAAGVSSFSVYPLYSPYRLVVDCIRPSTTQPAATLSAPAALPAVVPPLTISSTVKPLASIRPMPLLRGRPLAIRALTVSPPPPEGTALLREAAIAPAPVIPVVANAALPLPAPETAPPLPAPPEKNIAGGFSIARQLGLGVARIVIDPGHGGHDPGARGSGLTEAELVLDVSLRLEKLLTKEGMEVVLTRRTDDFVPLQERTAIANRERADLFLSIHANASTSRQARGVETYFLNFATNPSAEAIAARENAASGQAMAEATGLVNAILLNNKLDESRDLATMVQRAMVDNLRGADKGVRDLGVKQAPFVVLIGAAMPSVLAEISFVTNQQDSKLLRGSAYRQRIAESLFAAVRKYQTSLKTSGIAAVRP